MVGFFDFARKLWKGWSSASIMLVAAAGLVELGTWIVQFTSPQ
jgi:hypothetical protein